MNFNEMKVDKGLHTQKTDLKSRNGKAAEKNNS